MAALEQPTDATPAVPADPVADDPALAKVAPTNAAAATTDAAEAAPEPAPETTATPARPRRALVMVAHPDDAEFICGGTVVIAGTVSSSAIFGTINQAVTYATTQVYGEIAMLLVAIVLLRLLPQGITGRFFRSGT